MNKLTIFPLFFNFILFFFFLFFGEPQHVTVGWIGPIEVWFWLDQNFAIGAFLGIIIAIIIMGWTTFGVGFSSESVKLTLEITAFTAVWALMSIFTFPVLNSIQYFGPIIWSALTVSYGSGVFLDIASEGVEGA